MKTRRDATCPLCDSDAVTSFFEESARCYLRCLFCRLVFVPERYWLSREEEKTIYDAHENDAEDLGYRTFLSRLSVPLLEKLDGRQKGLDFGCGPGPALSGMLEEHGHQVDLYDPFYCNDPGVFKKKYDFICATEVVEHLREPQREWTALFTMLKPGGWLGIMTKLVRDQQAFSTWHYIRDKTHISFYSQSCMSYLAAYFNAELIFPAGDVLLFRKKKVK